MYKHKKTGIIVEPSYPNLDFNCFEGYFNKTLYSIPRCIVENSNDWKKRVGETVNGEDLFEDDEVYIIGENKILPFILTDRSYGECKFFKTRQDAIHHGQFLSLSDIYDIVSAENYNKLRDKVESNVKQC